MGEYLLAIDQGTTSSRVVIYNRQLQAIAFHQQEFTQYFPKPGWVEHDANEIWQSVLTCCHKSLSQAGISTAALAAIGISNQRETTVGWRRSTGEPIAPAIVWQDRRTSDSCQLLRQQQAGSCIQAKTGLLLDAYFSATKMQWLIDAVARPQRIPLDDLLFGTIDTYLIWRLTNGRRFVTDVTNAARTLLFNIHRWEWDKDLLALFAIERTMLPEVLANVAEFGLVDRAWFGHEIPILGVAGDQQAAMIGQACFNPGDIKCTLGTGAFMLVNTGKQAKTSCRQLLTTIGYRVGAEFSYALEASIFNAGTVTKWLRDKLHVIEDASASEQLAGSLTSNEGVYLVPAFTGLGAPHWQPDVRGTLIGITRDTGAAQLVRAGLESIAYQVNDLLASMAEDIQLDFRRLRVDGGMARNNWLLQFMADMLQLPVDRPVITETTALGAAMLAGIGAGFYPCLAALAGYWQLDRSFMPSMSATEHARNYQGWQRALRCAFATV